MRTDADERVDKTKEHINDAIHHLKDVIVNECEGSNEYNQNYKHKLRETFDELLNLRNKLKT